ncbi:AfsR/SARP family transcriptional regulator [Mycobacterium sp. PDNC021]|uniref:AfsR/SARP family transcriptional regulator n=1 Tax=Mycobacterium sp. PDNC021 TaxID=3391399 RepID=UPI003AAF34B5
MSNEICLCPLRFQLFGRFQMSGPHTPDPAHRPPRRMLEVLCFLLLVAPKAHHREQLADLLWGESDSLNARKHLRQAVWHLQTELTTLAGPEAGTLLRIDSEWLQVDADARWWTDARELREAHERVRNRCGADLDAADVAATRKAVELYRGELLEGWYQDWCIHERERYRAMRLALLEKLLSHAEHAHSWDEACTYAETILEEDRAHERTHLRLMRIHVARGDRTGAIRQYAACRDALQQEFAVEPGPDVVAVYEQAREGHSLRIADIISTDDADEWWWDWRLGNGPGHRPELVVPKTLDTDELTELYASLRQTAALIARHLGSPST